MSMPEIDVARARAETPACQRRIHFNNAGASLLPEAVLTSQIEYLKQEADLGGYETARHRQADIEAVYSKLAHLLNAQTDEFALFENATLAWEAAFYSIQYNPDDYILIDQAAYGANYVAFLHLARRRQLHINVIPSDEYGQVSLAGLEKRLKKHPNIKLVVITHMPTNGGLLNPAQAVGQLLQDYPAFYLLDACQSVGQMPLDVQSLACDMLSAAGRKFLRGPRGTGFLYVRGDHLNKLMPHRIDHYGAEWLTRTKYRLRADTRRFETWESNYAAKIGLGTAIAYAQSWGLDAIWARVQSLAHTLRQKLQNIPQVQVHDLGQIKGGIVTFTKGNIPPSHIQQSLAENKINVSVSNISSTRLDMEARHLSAVVRASVHYYNTTAEIDRFCEVVAAISGD